jgi:hypothetical protein
MGRGFDKLKDVFSRRGQHRQAWRGLHLPRTGLRALPQSGWMCFVFRPWTTEVRHDTCFLGSQDTSVQRGLSYPVAYIAETAQLNQVPCKLYISISNLDTIEMPPGAMNCKGRTIIH